MINTLSFIKLFSLTLVLLTSACGGGSSDSSSPGTSVNNSTELTMPETGQAGDGRLQEIVDYLKIEGSLPALAAIMVHDGEIIEYATTGLRSIERDVSATELDKWHIGSITKSMTSTLAAILVEQGFISWDTTLLELFPEFATDMQEQYKTINLEQLLSHTSGFAENIPTLANYYHASENIVEQRLKVVNEAIKLTPVSKVGDFQYSNLGYIIAGAMLEKVTGSSWESLMETYLFSVLSMSESGFGAPDILGELQQPVGHINSGNSWKAVMENGGTETDNPPVLGPAGTVHVSLNDIASYLMAHLSGAKGEDVPGFLTAGSFSKLHNDISNIGYGLGWGINGNALIHSGSNTMWLAKVVLSLSNDTGIFVVTNSADLLGTSSLSVITTDKLVNELKQRAEAKFGH